jgi:hypothetical protein
LQADELKVEQAPDFSHSSIHAIYFELFFFTTYIVAPNVPIYNNAKKKSTNVSDPSSFLPCTKATQYSACNDSCDSVATMHTIYRQDPERISER